MVDWTAVVTDAVAAPSSHNTQPWRFLVRGCVIELHLDPARVLPVADPDGRQARLACGAALFNLRLALRVRGHSGQARLCPDRARPTLLATVRVGQSTSATPLEARLHRAIHHRHSQRRPFLRSSVPLAVRRQLIAAALTESAELRLLDDRPTTGRLTTLIHRAERTQHTDPRFAEELAHWTTDSRTRVDGVPRSVGGPRPDLDPPLANDTDPLYAVLLSHGDGALDQLRAGQALQRVLLTATAHGAAATMLSQPVELTRARPTLKKLLHGAAHPQLVLRIGMASPTRTAPRRSVSDVLRFDSDEQ